MSELTDSLLVDAEVARSKLASHISRGREILTGTVPDDFVQFNNLRRARRSWSRVGESLLGQLFAPNFGPAAEYRRADTSEAPPDDDSFPVVINFELEILSNQIDTIEQTMILLEFAESATQEPLDYPPSDETSAVADDSIWLAPDGVRPWRFSDPPRALLWTEASNSRPTRVENDLVATEDSIGTSLAVEPFAQLVVSRAVAPPISIAIFGQWGTGKSFFMRQIQSRVRRISKERANSSDYPPNVIQIEFNAWHYIESNLWASLIETIFRELSGTGSFGRSMHDPGATMRSEILTTLESTKDEAKDLVRRLRELREGIADIEKNIVDLENSARKKEAESNEPSIFDVVKGVALTTAEKEEFKSKLSSVGFEPARTNAKELLVAAAEAGSQLRTLRGLLLSLKERPVLLFAAVASIVAGPIVSFILTAIGATEIPNLLASVSTTLAAATLTLRGGIGWVSKSMRTVESVTLDLQKKVDAEIASVQAETRSAKLELANLEQKQVDASKRLADLKQQQVEAQNELDSLTPAKVLTEYATGRAKSGDYSQHLGLPAMIKRDLEALSQIVGRSGTGGQNAEPAPRIVLYIDDLDRCPPGLVVEVLHAVHLLTSYPLFMVFVGVDKNWLQRSLSAVHSSTIRSEEHEGVSADDYLEKIFQIPFWIQSLDLKQRRAYLGHLIGARGGGWRRPDRRDEGVRTDAARLTENGSETITRGSNEKNLSGELMGPDIGRVAELAPVLITSPRNLKRFVNTLRLVRIAVSDETWARDSYAWTVTFILGLGVCDELIHREVLDYMIEAAKKQEDDNAFVNLIAPESFESDLWVWVCENRDRFEVSIREFFEICAHVLQFSFRGTFNLSR